MIYRKSQYRTIMLFALCFVFIFASFSGNQALGQAPAPSATAATGAFDLPDPRTGLATLSSYRATLKLAFEGTKAGKPDKWSRTFVMLASQKPAIHQLTMERTGDKTTQVYMAELNGTRYERRGTKPCVATAIDETETLAQSQEPAGFLPPVIGAGQAGSETVSEIASNHFKFDQSALVETTLTQSQGDLWVATEGGYLVKYILVIKAGAEYFGEDIEGTLTLNYALSDINKPVAVKLPGDCPAGMVDAPLLPDAASVVRQPGVLTYTTVTSLAEIVGFYQSQIPSLGWKPFSAPSIATDKAFLGYIQGNQQLSIGAVVDSAQQTTTVYILLEIVGNTQSGPVKPPTRTPAPTRTPVPTRTPLPTKTTVPTRTLIPTRTPAK